MNPKYVHYISLAIQIANGAQMLATTYLGVNATVTIIVAGVGVFLSTCLHAIATAATPTPVDPSAPTAVIKK